MGFFYCVFYCLTIINIYTILVFNDISPSYPQKAGMQVSVRQIEVIMEKLDLNNDGHIDFGYV